MARWRLVPVYLGGAAVLAACGLGCLGSSTPLRASARPVAEEKAEPPPALRVPTEGERKAAIASIEAQLKAFKADDYEKATRYQHSSLRENFRSTDEFRRMMREVYPQFANYRTVTFGEARCDAKGDALQIQVTLTGQDGKTVRALYMMLREDGEYRVGGVTGGTAPKVQPRDVV